jgi:hypothetical protein
MELDFKDIGQRIRLLLSSEKPASILIEKPAKNKMIKNANEIVI